MDRYLFGRKQEIVEIDLCRDDQNVMRYGENNTNTHTYISISITMCAVLSWIGIVHMTDSMHVYFRSRVSWADIYLVGNEKSYKLTSVEMTK